MNVGSEVAYFPITGEEAVDWDCGRIVTVYYIDTPIGTYSYYREPVYAPACDGEMDVDDVDYAGQIHTSGPLYDKSCDFPRIGWFANSVAAQSAIHKDVVDRIRKCFKPNTGSITA